MTQHELKQEIAADLEMLKTLDLDVMPSDLYYMENFKLFKHVFLKLYFTVFGAACFSILFHWGDFFPNRANGLAHTFITFGGALLLTGFIFLFIQSSLNDYVLFYHQLREKLKTGELIDQNIKWAGRLAYRIFAFVVIVPTLFVHPGYVLVAEGAAFFISAILTGILVEMEMKRLGISTLFTILKTYFDKDKPAPASA